MDQVQAFNTAYATVSAQNTAYASLKTAYEDAVTKEKARRADLLGSAMSPAISIPERPCAP
jgi:hypothetical protein